MSLTNVVSDINGSVWKIEVKSGDAVTEDTVLAILESMKMEIPVLAPEDGVVGEILVSEGDAVAEGQILFKLRT